MIGFLKNLVVRDLGLKLFSLALAILIWFTVNIALRNEASPVPPLLPGAQERRTLANLPVLVVSSAEDARNFRINPKQVDVTVQGEIKAVRALRNSDIRVMMDLTGIGAAHDLRQRVEVSTPAGITHVRADPEEVQVTFPPKTQTE